MKEKENLLEIVGEMKTGYSETKEFIDSKKWETSSEGVAASHGVLLAAFELVNSWAVTKESTKGFIMKSLEMYWEFVKEKGKNVQI